MHVQFNETANPTAQSEDQEEAKYNFNIFEYFKFSKSDYSLSDPKHALDALKEHKDITGEMKICSKYLEG